MSWTGKKQQKKETNTATTAKFLKQQRRGGASGGAKVKTSPTGRTEEAGRMVCCGRNAALKYGQFALIS